LETFQRTSKDANKALLLTSVLDFISTRVAAWDLKCQYSRVDKWLMKHDKKYNHMLSDAVVYKKELEDKVVMIDANGGNFTDYNLNVSDWIAQLDLLMSSHTYSGSIFDLDEVRRLLGSVAKIDRLPNANSLEALRTLQDAWDHVEVYHLLADRYKVISKITYVMMLLAGIAITILSLLNSIYNTDTHIGVIALSFVGTCLAAYVSYTNPIVKWQQLRIAALTIESNIWTFRTRAGPYRNTGEEFDQSSEQLLAGYLRMIKAGILEGADIKGTSFYSHAVSQNKHKQHAKDHPTFGAMDSLMQPPKKRKKVKKTLQEEAPSSTIENAAEPQRSEVSHPSFDKIYSTSGTTYAKLSDLSLMNNSPFQFPGRFHHSDDLGSDMEDDEMAIDMGRLTGKREVPLFAALARFRSIQGE